MSAHIQADLNIMLAARNPQSMLRVRPLSASILKGDRKRKGQDKYLNVVLTGVMVPGLAFCQPAFCRGIGRGRGRTHT